VDRTSSQKANLTSAPAENYTYDNIYQLTQAVQNGSTTTESYTYDPVGNPLSSLAASPWNYNVSNQLTSITGSPGTSFTYDNNGNTTSKTDAAGTTTYTWDYENRPTSVTLPASGGTVSFTYDQFGRRIRKQSASATTIYAYDGENIVEETDAGGNAIARFAMGLSIDEPLAQLRSNTTHFYSADGLGSITSLTDASGAVANSYTYDTFGNLAASSGSVVNPFRYTAREWDAEISLHFYRARYYDGVIARFVSEDPLRFGTDEVSANLYRYAQNSPTGNSDPLGLYTLSKTQRVPPLQPSPEIHKLLTCVEKCSGIQLVVTSTSEVTPKHKPGTPHRRGVAVDVSYPSRPEIVLCCAAFCGAGFALDEKLHPSPQSSAPHLHIQIPRGPGGGRGDLPKRLDLCYSEWCGSL
jgi:RHS repeat-associated protein